MKVPLPRFDRRAGAALLAAIALLAVDRVAFAQDASKPAATAAAAPVKDERALALLKAMGDTLAGARTLSFKVRGIVPTPSPT
ncbi:hypothetical protein, partial [Variovorax saccharolyticus]|uniref:hypothetical protein n=1 Tax=Variovorax saccharolyticus TaxID=3053516 RepID=UPI002577184A